jgi:hypothetical protein
MFLARFFQSIMLVKVYLLQPVGKFLDLKEEWKFG